MSASFRHIQRWHARSGSDRGGFTLVELMLASVAGAIIFAALYGLFTNAVHMRDHATVRVREAAMRTRALGILRNDLQNGYISGLSALNSSAGSTTLAQTLTGSQAGNSSQFPGYLKFTTSTGKISDDQAEIGGDVQEVEYYIVNDPSAQQRNSGALVRAVTRDLLNTVQQQAPREETILTGVTAMELEFYDGTTWTGSWDYAPGNPDPLVPKAVRVRLRLAGSTDRSPAPAPIEVVAFWSSQPMYP